MPVEIPFPMFPSKIESAELNQYVMNSFRVAKQMSITDRINSIDFSPNGDTMISGDNSEQIIVYDCDRSEQLKTINVRKYGVDLVRYTQHPNAFVHTSTKINHGLRTMFITEASISYDRYYHGHNDRVVTLCTSPNDVTFISGALDHTLRLWELGSPECLGIMFLSGRPLAAFDPTGRIFAVGINSATIKLYDMKMYDKGPFVTFKMNKEEDCEWIELKFSPDGNVLMINTNSSIIRLIDAFDGKSLLTITGRPNTTAEKLEATFSPDSQFILSGGSDGMLHIWNTDTGHKVCVLNREKNVPMRCLRFNPNYMLLATADTSVNFWLPTI